MLGTAFTVTQILALSQSDRITARVKTKWLMVATTLASALVVFSYAVLDSAVWLLPLSLLNGFVSAFGSQSPMTTVILMNSISASTRGMVQGVIGTIWRAGMASGNLAMGGVWAAYDITATPLIGAVLLVVEAVWVFARLPEE